jgi:hypothetical protein
MIRGDHFDVRITSNDREHLKAALAIAFGGDIAGMVPLATHYKVEPVAQRNGCGPTAPALILAVDPKDNGAWTALPYKLNAWHATEFVWAWLGQADRGRGPDIDGTVVGDAFTVLGGSNLPMHDALVIVIPTYSIYHK